MLSMKKIIKTYTKSSLWTKLVFWLFILFIVSILFNKYRPVREGFIQKEKFILKRGTDIYDNFYASIYDDLVFSDVKNNFEVGEIIRITKPDEESALLDIGAGTGHHVSAFDKAGVPSSGLDISPDMVVKAKKLFPGLKFQQGDVTDFMLYPEQSFTHITCLYFTIYYINDKTQFFKNSFDWLMPGGYLILHLVNRDKFDPIVPVADPLVFVSPQKYAKKRITNSLVKFKDFQYKANFELDKQQDKGIFTETFKDDETKKVRQNVHSLFMPSQKYILSLAKNTGFILLGKIDMVSAQYEYQYLYILQKPR